MSLRTASITALAISLLLGCKSKDKDKDKPEPEVKQPPAASVDAAVAKAAPDAAPSPPVADAAPAAAPLTDRLVLEDIGMGEPIAVMVPANATHRDGGQGNDDELPSAVITAGEVEVTIETPEAGFFTLDEEKAQLGRATPPMVVERADADPDGFTMIYLEGAAGKQTYSVTVSRPSLKVSCGASGLPTRAAADRAVEICRTVKAATE